MIIGDKYFKNEGKTYVMGILNVTPDSFSDGGKYNNIDNALKQTEKMINDGAHIIDIGAQSTRPGYNLVGPEEELKRMIPVIEQIKKRFDIPLSVDTFHSGVAKEVLDRGVELINDIWGLCYEKNEVSMAEVIGKYDASVCIMHNSLKDYSLKCDRKGCDTYNGIYANIRTEIEKFINIALKAGINSDKIMLDPGIGFAKDYDMNMDMIANAEFIKQFGYPVLLGVSNKSVIGNTLNLPVEDRLEGTLAATAYAVMQGYSYVRVHDVKSNVRVINMLEKLMEYR